MTIQIKVYLILIMEMVLIQTLLHSSRVHVYLREGNLLTLHLTGKPTASFVEKYATQLIGTHLGIEIGQWLRL